MKKTIAVFVALTALTTSGTTAPLATVQRPVRIALLTLAPRNSEWWQTLARMGADWREATSGAVELVIRVGDSESKAISMMRVGEGRGVNAAAISNDGLAEIEPGAFALNMPLVFDSYQEWDYVRQRVNPLLEKRLAEKGFIVLTWSDIGWVHFFSVEPLSHPDQLKERRLAASATDDDQVDLLKSLGFNPVPTPQHDVVTGLQTGRIDTLYMPIIFAEATQLFRNATYMTELAWAPLQGAVVVHKNAWDSIASNHQEAMLRISREIGEQLRRDNRDHEQRSLAAMVERELNVVEVDEAAATAWRRLTEDNFDRIRGVLVDEEIFARVMELRDEYRSATDGGANGPQ